MKKSSRPPTKKPRKVPRFPAAGVRFEALDHSGPVSMSVDEAARVTCSSVKTVNRWRRTGKIPPPCLRLLQLHQAGLVVPESWRRCPCAFTRTGELIVGGYVFQRGTLEGYGTMLQALRALQNERAAQVGLPVDRKPRLLLLPGGLSTP